MGSLSGKQERVRDGCGAVTALLEGVDLSEALFDLLASDYPLW
jgi:hypothetical protein